MSRLMPRRLVYSLAVALLTVLAVPGTSSARAQVEPFFDQRTETNEVGTPECVSGDFTGTETLTFTVSGFFVVTKDGFHVQGTETLDISTEFTNGYSITGTASSHFTFNATKTFGETVFTQAGHEVHYIYDAEGAIVATVLFAGVSHITYTDLNGNEQPDEGEITANFEHFHFTCI